jgi:hypothetical protein
VINDNNRIFIFNDNSHKLCYSDDNGDTWQEQASGISTNWVEGMYSLSNDTIVMVNNQKFFWTLDGGESWNETNISFLQDMVFTDILADHAGNVYVSITNAVPIYELGIYTANFNDIDNWTWLIEGAFINHMELDPEGNVVAGGYGQYQQQPDLYLVPDWRFTVADNGIVYDLHNVATNDNYAVLRYSADHGETFYEYGEALPLYSPAPGGMGDGSIYKGRDGHLYFGGHGARMKSVFNTNDIHYIEGEVVVLPYAFAFGNYPYGAGQAIRVDDDHIYPVTVDGFRPDPTDLSRLIVRYDTIPMGATIGAFGTIKEMHDYVGDSQNVLDIQQTTAHYYDAITATLEEHWNDNKVIITNKKSQTYYITINGEKQDFPLVFNGDTLYWGCLPRTFIGHCGIQTDQYANHFYGMELVDIQPFMNYNYQLEDGTLTTDYWDPPCLSCPCEEDENQHFLTFLVGDFTFPSPFYLMRNGQLYKNTFINNNIFREGMHVDIKGIHYLRYDMPGETVHTIELVEMDTDEEVTLTGTIVDAPMPHTGYIPLPGMEFAFMANGTRYYLENEQDYDWILVGNDTIYLGQEITATFTTKMMLDFNQNFYYRINITAAEPVVEIFPRGTEWYYEIKHLNGDVTYQHLEYAADTAINSRRVKIITETNTMYDKQLRDQVEHEYIYEDGDLIYWWNKELQEFTLLYDFGAEEGDEWDIQVGEGVITVHVDVAQTVTYKSGIYRVLSVSDPDDLFTGDIVCGIGHLTKFFPEITPIAKDYEVDGLRCYWQDGELVLNMGQEDCDAIYNTIHTEVDENTDAAFTIYPNPTNGILFVGTHRVRPTDRTHSMCPYRITNILGQTVKSGYITSDNQQIDVRDLNQGFYFITIDETTQKIIINP